MQSKLFATMVLLLVVLAQPAIAQTQEAASRPTSGPETAPNAAWSHGPSAKPDFFPLAVWLQDPKNAPKFKALGIRLAQEHPGYNLGTVNGRYGSDAFFGSSGCPIIDVTSVTTVKIDTSSPKCTRANFSGRWRCLRKCRARPWPTRLKTQRCSCCSR